MTEIAPSLSELKQLASFHGLRIRSFDIFKGLFPDRFYVLLRRSDDSIVPDFPHNGLTFEQLQQFLPEYDRRHRIDGMHGVDLDRREARQKKGKKKSKRQKSSRHQKNSKRKKKSKRPELRR